MFRTKLAVVISSVLLAAVTTQAQPAPADQTEATPPTQSSVPAETPTSTDADAASSGANESVGSKESNVDEQSTSGSYYPYSSGTVGDDPSEPKATSASAKPGDAPSESATGGTDQWKNADTDGDGYLSQDELKKVAPTLADSFDDIDVDDDDKLTRGEFRTWHESQKARKDADQAATPATPATPAEPAAPDTAAVPATPATPAAPQESTSTPPATDTDD